MGHDIEKVNLVGVTVHGVELAGLLLTLLQQQGHINASNTPRDLDALLAEGHAAVTFNDKAKNDSRFMRRQAARLLKQAEDLDGLKPSIITHNHEYGFSSYIGWSDSEPTEEKVVNSQLGIDYEPDRGESLDIEQEVKLEELTGSSDKVIMKTSAVAKGKGRKP